MTPDEYRAELAQRDLAIHQDSSAAFRGRVRLEEADALPGGYYVTARDELGRTAYLLGPFLQHQPGKNAHARALGRVRAVRRHVADNYPRSIGWTFGTARVARLSGLPIGKLNALELTR